MTAIKNEAPTAPTVKASISTNQSGIIDMTSLAIADRTINVPFHGASLFVVSINNEPYVPMKPIVEGMGLDWASQFTKIKQRFTRSVVEITMVASDRKNREMTCLAFRKFAAWLSSIQPNKVKPEIRERVIQYQEECDDVLYEYWTKGEVKNPRKATQSQQGKITLDQQTAIKQLVMYRGKSLPKDKQAKAIITMWSALKSHFGTTYKQIAEDQFTEALSLAARVPLDGEFIPAAPVIAPQPLLNEYDIHNIKGLCTHMDYLKKYFDEYKRYEVFTMLGSRAGTQMIDHMRDGVCFAATVRRSINELEARGLKAMLPS